MYEKTKTSATNEREWINIGLIMLNDMLKSNEDREWSLLTTKGATAEGWCKYLFSGSVVKFKKYLGIEFMNDFEKFAEEQTEVCNKLMSAYGRSFNSLKSSVEEQKVYIKKCTGEIKNSSEVLQQAIDKFNRSVDDEKLEKLTKNIVTITDCVERLSKLENIGMLNKVLEILSK